MFYSARGLKYTYEVKNKKILIIIGLALAITAFLVFALSQKALSPAWLNQINKPGEKVQKPTFDKQRLSITDPNSIWVIVNKSRILQPKNFTPTDLVTPNVPLRGSNKSGEMKLRKEPADALELMFLTAKKQGANLKLASGYRSYNTQISVYNNEVRQYGKAVADTQSARPGHSEHQTGLAADLQDANGKCIVADCFKDLPEGKWLAEHAWEYGFIIRYPTGKEAITGYRYEPWHIRYVGTELAVELHTSGVQTLEEFFGVVEKQPY